MHKLVLVAVLATAAVARPARATSSDQIWPEVNFFYSFDETTRLELLAEGRLGPSSGYAFGRVGVHVERQAAPLRERLFPTVRLSRKERATLALGYEYGRTFDDGGFGGASVESRVLAEATFRLLLPAGVLAADRNRVEGRRLDGAWSGRYRNRLELVRGFDLGPARLAPRASAEVFYDTRSASWTRLRIEAGVDIEELFGRGTALELYYLRQYDRAQPSLIDGAGITFSIYR